MNSLQDAHGRRFHYLRLSVTEICNFRCGYCLPNGYDATNASASEPLTVTEIRNLVSGFSRLGLRKVRITGGEPTLRRDLLEIVHAVKSTPGIQTIALTTNGHSLRHQAGQLLEAGVTHLNVSVDSLDRERFREITGMDRLPEILEGIDQAIQLRFSSVKLNAVLLKGMNDTQLDTFLEYVRTRPVSVRFIELMRTDDRAKFFAEHHLSADALRTELTSRGWTPVARAIDAGPAQEFIHPSFRGKIGLIAPYAAGFCDTCNRLRVSSQGDLRLCLFGEGRYPLRPLLQSPDQQDELVEAIRNVMGEKPPTHLLLSQNSGSTRHLAEIGG